MFVCLSVEYLKPLKRLEFFTALSIRVSIKKMGIVPFVATTLKGRFVVLFKIAFVGYLRFDIGLGDCPTRLEPPAGARNRKKLL